MSGLGSITILLVCQLIGEVIARGLSLPVPGPVIGMLLLFAGLVIRRGLPADLEHTGTTLLSHLSLLFVPAGVGIVVHAHLIAEQWLPITAALVVGTGITIAVTGLTMTWLLRRTGTQADPTPDGRDD